MFKKACNLFDQRPGRFHHIAMITIFGLVSIFLFSCVEKPTEVWDDPLSDRSFLTDKPCVAPCWYGLELDKASEAEVKSTIASLPFIDQESVSEFKDNWAFAFGKYNAVGIIYKCIHPALPKHYNSCGSVRIYNDKLKSINMLVGYELTMQMVVEKLGAPDYVESVYGTEFGRCEIAFSWPKRNIQIIARPKREVCKAFEDKGEISSDMRVFDIYYLATEGFTELPEKTRISWPGFLEP